MKILHVVAGDLNGGAARGAFWLHSGLLELGIDSSILTSSRYGDNSKSIRLVDLNKRGFFISKLRNLIYSFIRFLYPNRKRLIFSSGIFGVDITKYPEYKKADIIHLHWVNSDFVSIKGISKIKKPTVWTVRDMWPFTGGCHYSIDCTNYTHNCGNCPQLGSRKEYDFSRFVVNRKKRFFSKKIIVVGISNWICNLVRSSSVFKGHRVEYIQNNIDMAIFFAVEKKKAREALGLATNKKIILIGAKNVSDFYKGFNKFVEALKKLDRSKYFICFFGSDDCNYNGLGFEFKNYGNIDDDVKLRNIYSAADIFVAPSIMEAFGKTVAESMLCGTPVVCFDATGPKDIVDHKVNGYLATPFIPEDLAKGIDWIAEEANYDLISSNAKNKIKNNFSNLIVAKKYISLYKDMV